MKPFEGPQWGGRTEREQMRVYIQNVSKSCGWQVWFPAWCYRKITEPLESGPTVSFQVTGGISLRELWDPGLFLSVYWAQLRCLPASVSHLLGWNESSHPSLFLLFYLWVVVALYIWLFCLHVCMYTTYRPGAWGGQNNALGPLPLMNTLFCYTFFPWCTTTGPKQQRQVS